MHRQWCILHEQHYGVMQHIHAIRTYGHTAHRPVQGIRNTPTAQRPYHGKEQHAPTQHHRRERQTGLETVCMQIRPCGGNAQYCERRHHTRIHRNRCGSHAEALTHHVAEHHIEQESRFRNAEHIQSADDPERIALQCHDLIHARQHRVAHEQAGQYRIGIRFQAAFPNGVQQQRQQRY